VPLKFLYDIIVTKITLTKIVLVSNAHAGPSNNARPAFEMIAIALPARYALRAFARRAATVSVSSNHSSRQELKSRPSAD
jgi:hypothetical protein